MSLFDRPEELSIPVKRLHLDSLVDGPVLVDGSRFSGIGLVPTLENEFHLRPVRVVDGVVASDEHVDDPALTGAADGSFIDIVRHPGYEHRPRPGHDRLKHPSWLEKEHALDSEPITGSMVKFSPDGELVNVTVVENGQHVDKKRFDPSGVLVEYRIDIVPPDQTELRRISQSLRWSASGELRESRVFFHTANGLDGSAQISQDEEARLRGIEISGSYFDCVEQYGDLLVSPAFSDFGFVGGLGPAGQWFGFACDERSDELADLLISRKMLDEVSLLNPSGADHRGLARLSKAEMPNLRAVVVEPGYGQDYTALVDILGNWKRRTGVGASVEHHKIRLVSELTTDLEIHPANQRSEVGNSHLFLDDNTAEVVGLMGFLGDGLTKHVLQSPTLRFIRSTHAKTSEELRSSGAVAQHVAVYGNELEHEEWLELVRQQLFDESHLETKRGLTPW